MEGGGHNLEKEIEGGIKKASQGWGCNKTNQEFNTSVRTIIIIAESCEKTTEGAYYTNVNCGSEGAFTEKKM